MPDATVRLTIRIDPRLLAALRASAARTGRSASAEIVRIVQQAIGPLPSNRAKRAPTMGMFAGFECPSLAEFKRMRRHASSEFEGTTPRRRAR